MDFTNIANKLIEELKEEGIDAYIWHTSTHGSVYIRFSDNRMCSIRLGDHNGRSKLKYKFNIRSDSGIRYKKWIKDKDIWRLYLPEHKWRDLIPILIDRHKRIQMWETNKYPDYYIPKHKRNKKYSNT